MKLGAWIEAMRLRTLPVSVAGVLAGAAMALFAGRFEAAPVAICLAFAVLAQVSSNFANEYYDYKAGLDKPGREGPRRGVTEGDITPRAMKGATFATLGLACLTGLSLVLWGGWWLILVGMIIALGVMAYSTGPYPLSHHGLGEVAVMFFFGIIPVNFTFYLQAGYFDLTTVFASVTIGLMGANVLIVNNYRDADDDAAVGKHTLAVLWGRRAVGLIYLINGYLAMLLLWPLWVSLPLGCIALPIAYLALHTAIWAGIMRHSGRRLTPFLGMTAVLMLAFTIALLAIAA